MSKATRKHSMMTKAMMSWLISPGMMADMKPTSTSFLSTSISSQKKNVGLYSSVRKPIDFESFVPPSSRQIAWRTFQNRTKYRSGTQTG